MRTADRSHDYDLKVNQKLRSLFMKSFAESLVAVVSGVAIKKTWHREASPWYNFFEEIEVKPFRAQDARELVERPIRGLFRLPDRRGPRSPRQRRFARADDGGRQRHQPIAYDDDRRCGLDVRRRQVLIQLDLVITR